MAAIQGVVCAALFATACVTAGSDELDERTFAASLQPVTLQDVPIAETLFGASTVTLKGSGFAQFNGYPIEIIFAGGSRAPTIVPDDNTLVFVVPQGATSGRLSVLVDLGFLQAIVATTSWDLIVWDFTLASPTNVVVETTDNALILTWDDPGNRNLVAYDIAIIDVLSGTMLRKPVRRRSSDPDISSTSDMCTTTYARDASIAWPSPRDRRSVRPCGLRSSRSSSPSPPYFARYRGS